MPWLSSALTDESALPTLRTSSSASSLRLATSASASACSRRERSVGGVRPQSPSSAARAASTARSISASVAMATFASGSPVAGSDSSFGSPPEASDGSPLMKSRYSRSVATAIGRDPSEVRRRELFREEALEALGIARHEGLAETVALDVRDRVRAPQRVGDEAQRLVGSLLGRQRPAHQVVAGLVERPAVRVHHQRDVVPRRGVLRGLLHRRDTSGS